MIFSVYNYTTQRYTYYEAHGVTPPHGWFRKPTPGNLMQPEELAAALPEGAIPMGEGVLPRGVIATDVPGVGTRDTNGPTSGAGAGLAGFAGAAPRSLNANAGSDPWESPNSRGRP